MFTRMKRTLRSVHPITLRRKARKLSGYALAKLIGISPSHLRDIETGRISVPRVELALSIARALDADVTELFRQGAA